MKRTVPAREGGAEEGRGARSRSRRTGKYVADVETDLDASLARLVRVPRDFNQIVLNIVVNAARAIGEQRGGGKGKIREDSRFEALLHGGRNDA